jgi:ABC-2 type transport system ATP-binding protein
LNLISFNSIHKKYGDLNALQNINLTIQQGSILGLLGPNGAGKTTILRIITGILLPSSGQYLFQKKPIGEADYRKIGYLPEERGLYKDMPIHELLMFLGRLKKSSRSLLNKKIPYWLDRFELGKYGSSKLQELSKGNQQKVQFISACIHDPELIILDEPFSGFDAFNSQLAIEVIHELNKSGTTFILSTHQMHTVENLCNHIAMIDNGKLILNGTVSDIKKQYKLDRIKISGRGHINKDAKTFRVLSEKTESEHIAILQAVPQFSTNEVLNELMKSFTITSFIQEEPGIEEIFLKAIKPTNE